MAADARRQLRLEAAGFVVVRVTDFQVFHTPWEVVSAVRDARRQIDRTSPRIPVRNS